MRLVQVGRDETKKPEREKVEEGPEREAQCPDNTWTENTYGKQADLSFPGSHLQNLSQSILSCPC